MTNDFTYSSTLPPTRREELAALMFFNIQQHRFRQDIVNAIERYGAPEILVRDESLRFSVEALGEVQTLFALDGDAVSGRLLGVVVYARVSDTRLVLLHIGVDSDYGRDGAAAHQLLVLRLIDRVRRIGRSIRGVEELEILYGRGRKILRA